MSIKTNDFCKDISNNVGNRFDTSNYEANRIKYLQERIKRL